jgi:beta-ketoacyl-acyl-carrier-protein synthase II
MDVRTEYTDQQRVVVTGIGLLTPLGSDLETVWDGLLKGKSGVRRITLFDTEGMACKIAGEIPDFEISEYVSHKEARRMARTSIAAEAAANKAIADSGLDFSKEDKSRIGVCFGTAVGGLECAFQAYMPYAVEGNTRINPFLIPACLPNMGAFHVANRHLALGPNKTIVTACAAGTQAVGEGADLIRSRRADVVISGGIEALVKDFTILGFGAMRALPTSFNDDPTHASRPFDAKREGFVFSEGAACLILESVEHAAARGARIYCEVLGYSSSTDAFHVAAPDPEARGARRAMQWALEDAQLNSDEIGYINAHGTSTPANDAMETFAIKQVFDERAYEIPISSTKSMIGHPMGASGAIEASVCALSIVRNAIHPTINLEFPDPECDLDYVSDGAREIDLTYALSNSFGLGGQNACLVLGAFSS